MDVDQAPAQETEAAAQPAQGADRAADVDEKIAALVGLGGPLPGVLKWADANVNSTVGKAMDKHDRGTHPGSVKAHPPCNCTS